MYRSDVSRDELLAEIERLEGEKAELEDRLRFFGGDLPSADKLPVWIAPYYNWLGNEKGSQCPGCGFREFVRPRVKVHACDYFKGAHVHAECKHCHETSCWREKR